MAVALTLVAIAIGSVIVHATSPWWWTPIASNWGGIDRTIEITFWITGAAFFLVVVFMAYCVWRFRHRDGTRASYNPENSALEIWLAVLTGLGVAAMLSPGLSVWKEYVNVPPAAGAIEVVGQQWQWNFRLPGQDGKLGRTRASLVGADNPLGIDPEDSDGRDDIVIIADTLHLQLGHPVKVLLRSIDVVHDFYVPEFRAKMDLLPGLVTYLWFTPTRTGEFEILCAGYCGMGHPQMRGLVVVDSDAEYQKWLTSQKTFADLRKTRLSAGSPGGP